MRKKKTLIETNPYLRDPKKREKAIIWSVATSTAIETGRSAKAIARDLEKHFSKPRRCKAFHKSKKSVK
jgi:hypothetical protein